MSYVGVLKFLMRYTTVVNAYAAVELYGFPRAYRRMAEVLRKQKHLSPVQKSIIAENIKKAFRMPSTTYSAITESHTAAFLIKEAENLATTTHIHPPPVILAIAEMLFKKTPFGRVIDILKRAAKKREHAALQQELIHEQHLHHLDLEMEQELERELKMLHKCQQEHEHEQKKYEHDIHSTYNTYNTHNTIIEDAQQRQRQHQLQQQQKQQLQKEK